MIKLHELQQALEALGVWREINQAKLTGGGGGTTVIGSGGMSEAEADARYLQLVPQAPLGGVLAVFSDGSYSVVGRGDLLGHAAYMNLIDVTGQDGGGGGSFYGGDAKPGTDQNGGTFQFGGGNGDGTGAGGNIEFYTGSGGTPGQIKFGVGGGFQTSIILDALSADRQLAFPDASGTIALTSDLAPYALITDLANYLKLDASNDPVTGQLNINVATASLSALVLKTTDDNTTNPIFSITNSTGTSVFDVRNQNVAGAFTGMVNINGTLASLGQGKGIIANFTPSASAGLQVGMQLGLLAPYSGSGNTIALSFFNTLSSTSATGMSGGNFGILGSSSGATAGYNWGGQMGASGSTTINGAASLLATGNATGVALALYTRASGSSVANVGGYFGLYTVNNLPSFTSSALIADNAAQTAPIFIGRDNGTAVHTVGDGGATLITVTTASLVPLVLQGASSQSANVLEIKNSAGTVITNLRDSISGAATTSNFLNVTGTFPTVMTDTTNGVLLSFTTAGTSSFSPIGLRVELNAGYTGSSSTIAISFLNSVAGTNATYTGGNAGATWIANGTTVGYNIGFKSAAQNSSTLNIGGTSKAVVATNGTNIGITGFALNGTTANIGGLFHLSAANTIPTLESAALIADNMATTSPIFLARDNGTKAVDIIDGGNMRLLLDSQLLVFGAGQDATITYDGTDMIINPKLVGTGVLKVLGDISLVDEDVILGTSTGTKFGTATTQKLGFWNAAPIVQPTTAIAAATFVANTSGIVDDTATWDGYTFGQVVKSLRNTGLLA